MASVLQQYHQLADRMATQITGSYQSWTDFLTTAARLYKYPYHEQLMIYAQRPDATACAEYDLWNKRMGRYIRRGAKGIALIDHSGDAPRLRYVFDVADTRSTERSRSPYLWEFRPEHEQVVSAAMAEQYNIQYPGNLVDQLEQISSVKVTEYFLAHEQDLLDIVDGSYLEQYHDYDKGVAFLNAATVSTTYMLLSRCGLAENAHFGSEDFMPVFDFNTPQAVDALGSAISGISEEILRNIEVTIKKYEREKLSERSYENDRTDLYPQRGLLDSQPEPVPAGEQAPGQVREDAEEVSTGASPGAVEPPDPVGAAVPPSAGDRRDGKQAVGADDAHTDAVGRGDGSSESQRPDEVGGADEQPESPSRGSDPDGADLRLTDEPPTQGEQFSFFPTEAQQIAYIAQAESADIAPSAFSMPQEYIDQFLRVGSNTENHRTRIAIEYAKQQPMDDLVDFLEKAYHGGYGLQFGGQKVSAWYSEDGMRLSYGSTARYAPNAQILSWENVAVRIGELLEQGQFATNMELADSRTFEKRQLSEQLWYMAHDMSNQAVAAGYVPIVRSLRGGFPEETEKLMVFLSEPVSYQAIMKQVYTFRDACAENQNLMRFQMYNPRRLVKALEEYALPRREYTSKLAEFPQEKSFITQDEIDEYLIGGSSFDGSKRRIYAFFQETHTTKEKLNFLKKEYGIGGSNCALSHNFFSDASTDGRGIRFDKPHCPRIELPWAKAAELYDHLLESGRFTLLNEQTVENSDVDNEPAKSPEPVIQEISAPAEWEYNTIKQQHPDDIVLFQVGDFFEMYGEDARQAAKLLELTLAARPVPGAGRVEMCGIPAHHLEQYTEKLREQFDVTIAAIPETGTERRIFTLRSIDHEAEAAINAQEAEFGADGTRVFHAPEADLTQPTVQDYLDRYTPVVIAVVSENTAYRNACGHTDRENAQIECNAAVRRAVLQMKNTELLKAFLDMPEFRSRLHSEVFGGTYAQLHELLRPLSQDDIDDALRRWNGDIASKRAVYRYMSAHGRESDTSAWLEQEFSAEKKPFIVRPGSPESYEMPWAKVQRRIAQLIRTEQFYTEEEQDRLDDIDPIAIREQLAESGIIDGKVVDPEKLNNNPFIRMVTEDVQRISDEEFAKDHLIPGESTFEIDGRTFLVDRVNLDSCSVNFQDITFSNATGFPIFRTESIAFIRKYVEEQEKQSVQPVTSAETVAVYPGKKTIFPMMLSCKHSAQRKPRLPSKTPRCPFPLTKSGRNFPVLPMRNKPLMKNTKKISAGMPATSVSRMMTWAPVAQKRSFRTIWLPSIC